MLGPKAQEILELNVKEAGEKMPPDTLEAVKLGVEALDRHNQRHHNTFSGMMLPLPSETSDEDSP